MTLRGYVDFAKRFRKALEIQETVFSSKKV